jgi:hypothetical protein
MARKFFYVCAGMFLLLAAPPIRAAGINLAWNSCFGDGGTFNRTFACDRNTGSNLLVGTFVLGSDLPQVSGMTLVLDVTSTDEALPAWWQFKNAGTCRTGSLALSVTIPSSAANCADWAQGQASGGIAAYNIGQSGPNTARIVAAVAVPPSLLQDLVSGQEYFSFNLVINNQKTVGTGACTGCNTQTCIAFSSLQLQYAGSSTLTLTTPGDSVKSSVVTWQGGPGVPPPPGSTCSGLDSVGFSVTTSVVGRGTVTRSRTKPSYTAGTPLTLTAVPLPGDRFVAWSGDTTTTESTLSIVVYRDLTYFATFERDPAAAASLASVSDIPADQGTHVLASWNRSPIDDAAYPGMLCCYRVERTLSLAPMATWVAASGFIPATNSSKYSQVVITPADSTQLDPAQLRYRVVTMAAADAAEWISNEVIGYSVDNLAPPQVSSVSGVMASGSATMFWPAVSVADLAHYSVYRGLEGTPPTDAAHRIGTTSTTTLTDSPGYFANYCVTSVDTHGNESPGTPFVPLNSVDAPGSGIPKTLSVGNPSPSPMAHRMSMTLGLPRAMSATVDVLDSQGRLVRRLCEGEKPAGWSTLSWDARDAGGHAAAAGMYFVRVQTPEGRSVKRLALIP